MRQRILIAAAMLDKPEILILDEPTAGLDPEERIRLCNYISDMARNRTIILATHVVSDIEAIANQVLILCKGKPAAMDTPLHLILGIQGKVFETHGSYEEILSRKKEFDKGQIYQTEHGFVLRVTADSCPAWFSPVEQGIDLEDVYLYYAEGRK